MARRKIPHAEGIAAIRDSLVIGEGESESFATAVRFLLEELASIAPGSSVEVRVPPFGATQCIEGPRHSRGTPQNIVEMTPEIWFALATGRISWNQALETRSVSASGIRATLENVLPLEVAIFD